MKHKLALLISVILAVIPLFWLSPSELDLGGDSSRLYLYDPLSYLRASSLYSLTPDGMGDLRLDQSMLPFLLLLEFFYLIFHSPYILTILMYSLSLAGAFLFTYLIVLEILKNHIKGDKLFLAQAAAILSGIFYTFAPSVGKPMQVALIMHNQVFLNPMIVYLMLRFLVTQKNKYLWFALLTTFIFSPNFSLAVPALFSFYPLALLFLILYVTQYLKKSLPWKKLLIGIILFLGIHAFHNLPVIVNAFDSSSYYNLRIFNADSIQNTGLNYFNGVLPYGMVIKSFLYTYGAPNAQWAVFVGPLIIILGFLISRGRQKDLTLIAIFFFITTFLESANITQIGLEFYRLLFYIPGFSMFRNFYGQWQWIQTFFYALLLGYAFFLVFSKLKKKIVYIVSILIVLLLVYSSWIFVSGQILRQPHRATENVSTIIEIDSNYEKTLSFFRNQQDDGKIFDFPFTEFGYQVVPGLNRGAYIGPSPTSYLTGRRDFSGQQILEPFSDLFLKLIEKKDYSGIKRLLGLLNVEYAFYIANPKAYQEFFPSIPYTLFLKILPDSKSLTDFVGKITGEKIFEKGNYLIYKSDTDYYLPHFYVPISIVPYANKNESLGKNVSFFVNGKQADPRILYLERSICAKIYPKLDCRQDEIKITDNIPSISYKRINPTKYKVVIYNAKTPFSLIFLDKFNKAWKAYILNQAPEKLPLQESYFGGSVQESYHSNIFLDGKTFETLGMKSLPEKQHFIVNGYANAWQITPADSAGKINYEIIVEMGQQRIFYYSLGISVIALVIFLFWGGKSLIVCYNKKKLLSL
jgi:hypothetical protein